MTLLWKKLVSTVLIANMVLGLAFPVVAFADNNGGGHGSTSTSGSVTCQPKEHLDASGENCVPDSPTPSTSSGGTTGSGACAGLTGSALTNCQNTTAAYPTLLHYNPNVSLTGGNTYNGISIHGVGGAIASCANVGGMLVSAASNLISNSKFLTKVFGSASSYKGGGQAVSTSDQKSQEQLATINRTQQCLDGVAYAVAKNTLAQVTTKTLNWVNTGLHGNPLYVQNVGSYLSTVKNQQVRSFLNTVQASNPIFGNALQSSITFQTTGLLNGRISVAMNTPQARAYSAFQADFTNGGWNALLNPAYNPVGALFNASDQLARNVYNSQLQGANEVQRNNGFLDVNSCAEWANNGIATTDGANAAQCSSVNDDATYELCCTGQSAEDSATCNAYALTDDGGDPQCANITDDTVYNKCCGDGTGDSAVCKAYDDYEGNTASNSQGSIATTNGAALSGTPECLKTVTTTPGSVIASQVSTLTASPIRQLEYADKINEVLGSFFDSFVNNLLSKGLRGSGTGNVGNTNLVSVGDNIVTDLNGNALNANATGAADALGYQSTASGSVGADFDISRPQQLRSLLQAQKNFLVRAEDAQTALNRVVPAIGALDYCIPGPNPDWQTGLDGNWQSFIGGIQQADEKDPSTVEKIISSLPGVGSLLGSIVSLFTGSGSLPGLWTSNPVLSDKVTGQSLQINRVLYTPQNHRDGVNTSDIQNAMGLAYQTLNQQYSFYGVPNSNNDFKGTPIGDAFQKADPNNQIYVNGFLRDAYVDTDSITGYNQAASEINQTYSQDISNTQDNIEQLQSIMNQVNSIVATAKARYEKQHPEVNTQCLDQAYQINTSPVSPVAHLEPDPNDPLQAEENAMITQSAASGNYFYNDEIK